MSATRGVNGEDPGNYLAQVAHALAQREPRPSMEEFEEALGAHVIRYMLLARIDETRSTWTVTMTERMQQLSRELYEVEKKIATDLNGH